MAQTTDTKRNAPPAPDSDPGHRVDGRPEQPADDQDDATWAPSSWDLRQGLDVAELDELPAEWPPHKPR